MPRFVTGEPPTDADIAAVITKISHRVIRKLRQLGYLETGLDAAVATGYDPLRDDAPELAHTMAASVQQRIAFGERTGQQVRHIGSGFGAEGEAPRRTGPRCASMLRQGSRCWISPSEQCIVALNSQIITVDERAGWCFSTMSSLAGLPEPRGVFIY